MTAPTRDIAAERAAIDRAVAGKTIPSLFKEIVEQHADTEALTWGLGDQRQALTWAQYRDQVREATMGLLRLGFRPGEFGLIMARNRPEHLIADLAITHAGGSSVSVYNSLAPEQIAYIANHCSGTIAFVEDNAFLEKWQTIRADLPWLRHVVLLDGEPGETGGWVITWQQFMEGGRQAAAADPGAFDASWQQVKPDDIIALIYTSGTTGTPKGVTYTHTNIIWTCESSRQLFAYEPGQRYLSYLPLAHIAERYTTHWGAIFNAATTHLVPDPALLVPSLLAVRPTLFVGVPRVWEKFQSGITLGVAAEPDEQRRAMVQGAMEVGRLVVELVQAGQAPPPELAARAAAVAPVLTAVRGKIGLDQCTIAYTSTAPTPLDVLQFFAGLNLPIVEVWGMSELTGPATANPPSHIKLGTVGVTLPGVEGKLDEDGELLIRGGNVMPAYYREPDKTAEIFDEDGWLRSGDIATVDAEGYYRIVDRKKELLITSYGKNIAPSLIESQLKHHPLIGQAIAIGDNRPYVTALIVLDQEVLPTWAKAHGVVASGPAELASDPTVVAEVERGVIEANSHLNHAEQVKRFTILPGEWTAESEELTPTLKLKRRVVLQKYAGAIEGMYGMAPTGYAVGAEAPAGAPAS